jgi:hypothetical protein
VIRLTLLDEEELSADARRHVESMLASANGMIAALAEITARLDLPGGSSTALAILNRRQAPR